MFLSGYADSDEAVKDAILTCYLLSNFDVTDNHIRYKDNPGLGLDVIVSNYAAFNVVDSYGTAEKGHYFYDPLPTSVVYVNFIVPDPFPPLDINEPDTYRSVILGQMYFDKNAITYTWWAITNQFQYPCRWYYHYNADEGESFFVMTDGYTWEWFASGIDKTTARGDRNSTGFWLWGQRILGGYGAADVPSYMRGTMSICQFSPSDTANYSNVSKMWPTDLGQGSGSRGVWNRAFWSDNKITNTMWNTYIGAGAYAYEWLNAQFDGINTKNTAYTIKPIRCWVPEDNRGKVMLQAELQTIFYKRGDELIPGQEFRVGLDTFVWYPWVRKSESYLDPEKGDIRAVDFEGNPRTWVYGLAVKRT